MRAAKPTKFKKTPVRYVGSPSGFDDLVGCVIRFKNGRRVAVCPKPKKKPFLKRR